MSLVDNTKLVTLEGKVASGTRTIILPSDRPGLLQLMSCKAAQVCTEQDLQHVHT